ncbi:MAG: hypothetical protein LBI78_00440 [Campylobacteraceae bacterium]|jgi:hypothetical protein|nr:hypothetical protein [Campylobacteraceae bacterium]
MHEDTLLDKIDNWLSAKSKNERGLIYIIACCSIVGIIYLTLFEPSEFFLSNEQRILNETTSKLVNETNYINSNSQAIPGLENGIRNYSTSLNDIRDSNNYIDGKLKELSYLLFNDQSWANFMDRLAFLAKEYNVNVLRIENTFLDSKDLQDRKVKQVLDIEVDFRSNFNNAVKFLNAIEESQLVVDVYNSTISSSIRSNSIDGNIQIAVWGMLY